MPFHGELRLQGSSGQSRVSLKLRIAELTSRKSPPDWTRGRREARKAFCSSRSPSTSHNAAASHGGWALSRHRRKLPSAKERKKLGKKKAMFDYENVFELFPKDVFASRKTEKSEKCAGAWWDYSVLFGFLCLYHQLVDLKTVLIRNFQICENHQLEKSLSRGWLVRLILMGGQGDCKEGKVINKMVTIKEHLSRHHHRSRMLLERLVNTVNSSSDFFSASTLFLSPFPLPVMSPLFSHPTIFFMSTRWSLGERVLFILSGRVLFGSWIIVVGHGHCIIGSTIILGFYYSRDRIFRRVISFCTAFQCF